MKNYTMSLWTFSFILAVASLYSPVFGKGELPCVERFSSKIQEKKATITAVDPYDDLWKITFDHTNTYIIHMKRGFAQRGQLSEWIVGADVTLRSCEKLDDALVITGKNHSDQSIAFLHKNEQTNQAIKNIQFIGERCSGTFFSRALLKANFQEVRLTSKYFFWHFPDWDIADRLSGEPGTLFVMTLRYVENWLSSFHKKPHFTRGIKKLTFEEFIRIRWDVGDRDKGPGGCIFDNVIKMRSARIKNYLSIQSKVDYFYFMNYEVIAKHPELVLAQIASRFNLKCTPLYKPITSYKGRGGPVFKPSVYEPISDCDKAYIQKELDQNLESLLGY